MELLQVHASELIWGMNTGMMPLPTWRRCVCVCVCFPALLLNKRGCVVSSPVHYGNLGVWSGGRTLRQATQLWPGEASCLWTEDTRRRGNTLVPQSRDQLMIIHYYSECIVSCGGRPRFFFFGFFFLVLSTDFCRMPFRHLDGLMMLISIGI